MMVYEGTAKLLPVETRFDVTKNPSKEQIRKIFLDVLQQNRESLRSVVTEMFLAMLWNFLNPKNPWDGNGLSKTECEQGQVVPGFCNTCRKSPDRFCNESIRERALKIRGRNIHGVILPINKREKFPVAALQWSTVYETAYRVILSSSCVSCTGCGRSLIDGIPDTRISVRRVRSQTKLDKDKKPLPNGVRWTESKSVYVFCNEDCKNLYIRKKPIFTCRRCGRLAQEDTKTLKSAGFCYRCTRRFLINNGLNDQPFGSLDKEAIRSFSTRVICQREARGAGFRRSEPWIPFTVNQVILPTLDGKILVRSMDHKRLTERATLLKRFERKKRSPD